ncbi:MAG: NAD(P)(+) transhydrogenase (Re/Si-specific) subunit alpha, partial [Acidimicrobiia bacterium]
VVVDLAAVSGGNCQLTRPGETVVHEGVTIVGATDLESRVATHASQMYARNVAALASLLIAEGEPHIDLDDPVVGGACITHGGKVVHPRVIELLEE